MPPFDYNAIQAPEYVQQQAAAQTEGKRAEHGLLTEALDLAFGSPAKKPGSSDIQASEVVSGFIKSVPLFMGPGRGTALAAVLNGIDEVHRGDSFSTQLGDFALGSAKGVANKVVMDKFGAGEFSMVRKGLTIGGSSAFIDTALTRNNWIDQRTGQIDITTGLENTARNTAFGAGVGAVAFPLGGALGSRMSPAAERLLGKSVDAAMVRSVTNGGAFGLTSGVVGETAAQVYSGKFDPSAIVKHGLVEGLSTAAAGGVGHRFSAEYSLRRDSAVVETKPVEVKADATEAKRSSIEPARDAAEAKRNATEPTRDAAETKTERTGTLSSSESVPAADKLRIRQEWEAVGRLSPSEIAETKTAARNELADIQIEPGKSAMDVINNASKSGALENPDQVMTAVGMVREHFTSLRTADGAIIPDQAANWVHTMGELARVVQYGDVVRSRAVAQSGETDPAKAKLIADEAMSPNLTKLAMIASGASDSQKSQAAEYARLREDGTTEAANLPANFHQHHVHGKVVADTELSPALKLTPREQDLVGNAILAHQVAPAETIMGLLYNFKISAEVGAIQKAAEAGDIGKLQPWVQGAIQRDPQFPQKLADALQRETRTMRDPAAESATGQVVEQRHGLKVIKSIADAAYLMMPAAEVPAGAQVPKVKMSADGKNWELDLNADAQMLLRLAGDSHWYVPHQMTAAERASVTPEQAKYFDDLWKVNQAVLAGDNGQYGARESVYKYVAALRGPNTMFKDGTIWDSIASIDTSRTDARRLLDVAGRQIMDDTNAKTSEVFDRNSGTFRRRADQTLLKEFGITVDGKPTEELQAVLKRTPIYDAKYPAVNPARQLDFNNAYSRLMGENASQNRAADMRTIEETTGMSRTAAEDYVLAARTLQVLNNIPYYGRPITSADYEGNTADFQTAVRVKQAMGDAARREASMNPEQQSDAFESVRQRTVRGN